MMNRISKIWFDNIKKLDTKNHLKHGEIYASDGSIHKMEINDNTVEARVEGAPGKFFDVEITFNTLSKIQKQEFINLINNDSGNYSRLINNQIPLELLNSKIKILPDSLKDFKMTCTCNNKGLFCKHKAAVFHKIRKEIDKNPFLIFSLLGLNLKEELEIKNPIKTIREVLRNEDKVVLDNTTNIDYLTRLNFMLSDYPSFYNSYTIDFNEILYDVLKSMSMAIDQVRNSGMGDDFKEYINLTKTLRTFEYFISKSRDEIEKVFNDKWMNPQKWNSFRIDINGNYQINKVTTGKINNFNTDDLKYQFFAFFAELQQTDTENYCEDIRFLNEVYDFTCQLIYLNALIPEFFSLDNGEHHIRWIPAYEMGIFFRLNELYDKCPENILTFYDTVLSGQNQVNTLISLFFEGFAKYYMYSLIPYKIAKYSNEFYFRLFLGKNQNFNSYRYEGKEIEVDNWISVLRLKQQDYKLILEIQQQDFEFTLDLKAEFDDEKYSIKDALNKRPDMVRYVSIIENVFSKFGFEYDLNNPKPLTLRQFTFFTDNLEMILNEVGISVKNPEELEDIQNIRLVLDSNVKNLSTSLSLDNLVDFDWKIAIGDKTYSIEEFKTFSQNYKGLIKINDKYFKINQNELDKVTDNISRIPKTKNKSEMLRYLLSSKSDEVEINSRLEELINSSLNIGDVEIPKSLNGELRGYQKTGFSWMIQNMKLGFGSILADDMGLGKTIQVLTTVLHLKEEGLIDDGKVLIVAPTSILTNWAKEVRKFTPSLKAEIYHGIKRKFPDNDFDILLTSYGVLRHDLAEINTHKWYLLVIDEAQKIKNPKAKQTLAVKSVDAIHHIALSGTPVENHLTEYWSIFDFINKGYLYSLKQFTRNFIKPIQQHHDMNVLDDFKKITSPFILRRLKTDKNIIKDLPDKIVNDIYCNLTLKQVSMYEETLNQLLKDVETSEGIQRKGLVLKLITALKQICNHPAQFSKSQNFHINESGKMEVLISILENIIDNDEKVLIFTQYVEMGNILKEILEVKFNREIMFLHGGVSRLKRDEMVDKFQNNDNKIFILSLKAGGIGLNLTSAVNVIHYDLWWNPAVENQATDRAYRIGQDSNVMVYRFITSGTLEERINQILLEKRQLVEMTVEGNETFITEMTNDELRKMLDLRNNEETLL